MEFLPSSSNADDGERERNEKNALYLSRHGFARSPSCHFVSFFHFTSPLVNLELACKPVLIVNRQPQTEKVSGFAIL